MSNMTPIQLYSVTEALSNPSHHTTDTIENRKAFGQAVKKEEIQVGGQQDRISTGWSTEIAHYEMLSLGSFNFNVILSGYLTALEGIIRSANPSKLFCSGGASLRVVSQGDFGAELFVENSIHLDYIERHIGIPDDVTYNIITHTDVESGTFPAQLDCAILDTVTASRNIHILDSLINNIPSGKTIILTVSLDQGFLAQYGDNHDFWPMFRDLASRDDIRVHHIPLSLGLTIITKR